MIAATAPSVGYSQTASEGALTRLRSLDRRVTTVIHGLSIANADLCPRTRNLAGWTLHSEEQYSADLRADAQRMFGLRAGLPSILAVALNGPARRAGFLDDDVIVQVNERTLEGDTQTEPRQARPSYERLGRQIATVDEALANGVTEVIVERNHAATTLTITPDEGCGYEAQVIPSDTLNAGADGTRISITGGLVAYAASDDDLALLLGHELAHNILRHSERPRASNLVLGLFGRSGRTPAAVREAETAADRLGLFLAARAGYDVSRAPAFRRRFSQDYAAARYGFWGYPSGEERAQAHEATVREINALRARGAPLKP